jgi:hypothetical protein
VKRRDVAAASIVPELPRHGGHLVEAGAHGRGLARAVRRPTEPALHRA